MEYQRINWKNESIGETPLSAENLNHMEDGIVANEEAIEEVSEIVEGKQDALTFDDVPTKNSNNPVKSNGIYDAILNVLPTDSVSGNPAVITDAFGGAVKALSVSFTPIQSGSGTPSPSNVRPISGRTQSIINATGRNLYIGSPSFDGYSNASNWALQSETYNGHEVYKNVGGWNGLNKTIFLKAGTYTFSCMVKGSQANTRVIIFNATNTVLLDTTVGTTWERISAVLVQGTDSNVTLRAETSGASPSLYVSEYMLEMGSEATPYQEWGESITRTYGTTIYGGTDDVTGEGATSTYGFVTFDGSDDESWTMFGSGLASDYAVVGTLPSYAIKDGTRTDILSANYLESITQSDTWGNFGAFISQSAGSAPYQFIIGLKNISTSPSALKAYLAEHPLQVCYKLATPTSIPLTAQNITLLHGDNVLTTDADDIEVSYPADVALFIQKSTSESSSNRSVDTSSLTKSGSSESTEDVTEEGDER